MKQINIFVRTISLVLALTLILGLCGPVSASAAENEWTLSDTTEIFWAKTSSSDKNNAALEQQVKLFAAELAEKVTDSALPISYGEMDEAGNTDIILVLDKTLGIDDQGYQVSVDGLRVTVSASDADGLFYGCRNLIQQLLVNGGVSGTASAPDVAERALSLDCGRKYYTVDWIKNMIKEMSWSNMNALVLHFSEEMGVGIESKTYPWLAGRDGTLCVSAEIETDNRYLTQDEVRQIGEVAKLYHVELIPSFDSPGHLNYAVKKYNEYYGTDIGNYFHYNGKIAIVQGSRNKNYSRGIDISNEDAVKFIRTLITEYGNLFRELGCTKFDIGGDELLGWGSAVVPTTTASRWQQLDHWKEYAIERSGSSDAVAYDGFMYYMNDLYDLVSCLGYTSVRMWNDDALRSADTGWKQVVTLNKKIEILYWTPSANNSNNNVWTYLNAGYKVHNYLNEYNYYVLGSGGYPKTNQKAIYEGWNPYVFDPDSSAAGGRNVTVGNTNVKGSAFCIWCDNPAAETESSVWANTLPMLRASGAKAWDADMQDTVSYATFTSNLDKIGNVPSGNLANVGDVYTAPDVTTLNAAIAEYEGFDASPYTEETSAAYAAAVEEGRQVLASAKPTQAQVDDAAQAIADAKAALREKPTGDTTALEAAIAEYETVDRTLYTADSFAAYQAAVNSGKELLASGAYTQEALDAAVLAIGDAKKELEEAAVGETNCFINGAFKTKYVNVGKAATLNMNVCKGLDIEEIKIYSDLGTEPTITRSMKNTSKSDRDIYGLMFSPTDEDRGVRTYTVYAILSDGSRSADHLTLTLEIR